MNTKDTPPDASAAAAIRYAGQGFLLGFLLCANPGRGFDVAATAAYAAPGRAAFATNSGPDGDAGRRLPRPVRLSSS